MAEPTGNQTVDTQPETKPTDKPQEKTILDLSNELAVAKEAKKAAKQEVETLEGQIKTKEEEINQLPQNREDAVAKQDELRAQLTQIRESAAQLTGNLTPEQAVTAAQQAVTEAQQAVDIARQAVNTEQQAPDDALEEEGEDEELEDGDRPDLQQDLETKQRELEAAQNAENQLRAQLDAKQKEFDEVQAELQGIDPESTQTKLDEAKKQLTTFKEKLDTAKTGAVDAGKKYDEAHTALVTAVFKDDQLDAEVLSRAKKGEYVGEGEEAAKKEAGKALAKYLQRVVDSAVKLEEKKKELTALQEKSKSAENAKKTEPETAAVEKKESKESNDSEKDPIKLAQKQVIEAEEKLNEAKSRLTQIMQHPQISKNAALIEQQLEVDGLVDVHTVLQKLSYDIVTAEKDIKLSDEDDKALKGKEKSEKLSKLKAEMVARLLRESKSFTDRLGNFQELDADAQAKLLTKVKLAEEIKDVKARMDEAQSTLTGKVGKLQYSALHLALKVLGNRGFQTGVITISAGAAAVFAPQVIAAALTAVPAGFAPAAMAAVSAIAPIALQSGFGLLAAAYATRFVFNSVATPFVNSFKEAKKNADKNATTFDHLKAAGSKAVKSLANTFGFVKREDIRTTSYSNMPLAWAALATTVLAGSYAAVPYFFAVALPIPAAAFALGVASLSGAAAAKSTEISSAAQSAWKYVTSRFAKDSDLTTDASVNKTLSSSELQKGKPAEQPAKVEGAATPTPTPTPAASAGA